MSNNVVDKSKLVDLDYLLNEEFKLTSKSGSYCSSSLLCCNTKQAHGLLACRLDQYDNEYIILLSFLEESIVLHGNNYGLGAVRKSYGFNFGGIKYLDDIINNDYPIIKFTAGPIRIRKEIILANESKHLFIRYTLLEINQPVILRLKPFLAFRKINKLTKAFPNIVDPLLRIDNGFQTKLYPADPLLSLQVSKPCEIILQPQWYYDFSYKDTYEPSHNREDLYVPGIMEVTVFPEDSIILSIGLEELDSETLNYLYTKELYGILAKSLKKHL